MSGNKIVYVIDDDEGARLSVEFLLEAFGYAAKSFASALVFLEKLPAEPGCVVTDYRMPGMDGLKLLKRLKEIAPELPVVVITGQSDNAIAVEAMRSGAVDVLEKPYSDDALLSAIEHALSGSSERPGGKPLKTAVQERLALLSPSEHQVLNGLVNGKSNIMIGQEMNLSEQSVSVLRSQILAKMKADNLFQLVRMMMSLDVSG